MTVSKIWKRTAIKAAIALIFVACIVWVVRPRNAFTRDPAAIAGLAAKIARQQGLVIGYGAPSTFLIPPRPVESYTWVIVPADIRDLDPALKALEVDLKLYPDGFFARHCKGVFFCGGILDGSERAGGTYGPCWLVIAAYKDFSEQTRYTEARVAVHHEFSSLIWQSLPFTQFGWILTLPSDWKPATSIVEALKAGKGRTIEVSTGFLSDYGATSAENDFNVYAQTIFTDPERIRTLAAQYPIIATKTAMFMNAYISVEPRMEQVFAKLKLLPLLSALDNSPGSTFKSSAPIQIPQGEVVH